MTVETQGSRKNRILFELDGRRLSPEETEERVFGQQIGEGHLLKASVEGKGCLKASWEPPQAPVGPSVIPPTPK